MNFILLLLFVIFVVLLPNQSNNVCVYGILLNEPNLLWTYTLEHNNAIIGQQQQQQQQRSIRKGNTVITDDGMIFVTAHDGSLHILEAPVHSSQGSEVSTVAIYEPPPILDHVTGNNKYTECKSGVSIVESITDNGREGTRIKSKYLVYAVIDTPIVSTEEEDAEGEEGEGSNNNNNTGTRRFRELQEFDGELDGEDIDGGDDTEDEDLDGDIDDGELDGDGEDVDGEINDGEDGPPTEGEDGDGTFDGDLDGTGGLDGEVVDGIDGEVVVVGGVNNVTVVNNVTDAPTLTPQPTTFPSLAPSQAPSEVPSLAPSPLPSVVPSEAPSSVPSSGPTDMPSLSPTIATSSITSRIIAVNMDGSLRWSIRVDGSVVGTPMPGQNGHAIYFTRNVFDDINNENNGGYLSVISTGVDGIEAPQLTASLSTPPIDDGDDENNDNNEDNGNGELNNNLNFAPFGPPTVTSRMEILDTNNGNGQFFQQPSSSIPSPLNDVILFAESWGDGYTSRGSLYAVIPSQRFDELGGRGDESYELKSVSTNWQNSVVVPPLVFESNIYLAGTGANIAGWTEGGIRNILENEDDNIAPRWSTGLVPNPRNESQPFLSKPAISSNGEMIFLPGTSNELYCLQSDRGREQWTDTQGGGSVILSQPKVYENPQGDGTSVVYVIEALEGRVRQHNTEDGTRNWEFSCNDISANGAAVCFDGVEAEFSLTTSGNILYYGDIFGRIVALQVAQFETDSPTATPSSAPSETPSSVPTVSPQPTMEPSEEPSGIPTATPSESPTSMPTESPSSVPTSPPPPRNQPTATVFDELDGLAEQPPDDVDDDFEYLAVVIGVSIAGLAVALVAVAIITKSRKKRGLNEDEEKMVVYNEPTDDLEEGGSPGTPQSAATTVSDDSVDREVGSGGSTVYSTSAAKSKNKKKKKRKNSLSNAYPMQTLDSIEEIPDDTSSRASSVIILEDEDGSQLLAEIDSESDTDSETMLMDQGAVGKAKNGTHLQLSVGNNKLKPLGESWDMGSNGSQEEKKDDPDDNGSSVPGSHYMSRKSASPSKYGQSARRKRGKSDFQKSESDIPSISMKDFTPTKDKKPSFKRRSKSATPTTPEREHEGKLAEEATVKEGQENAEAAKAEDIWSSFLKDLEDAEESFFAPSITQKSNILSENASVGASSENSDQPDSGEPDLLEPLDHPDELEGGEFPADEPIKG